MSENKTFVPGTETENTPAYEGRTNDFYERGNRKPSGYETYVGGTESPFAPVEPSNATVHALSSKPVVGFLYSISRTSVGEYWPLHVGSNTIGSSAKCEIQLSEATVSGEHADLVVRQMKKPTKLIASIADARSTNGTMINGESLGFSAQECFNGDVITFGEHYQCVLLLVDPKVYGLEVSADFIPVGKKVTNPFPPTPGPGTDDSKRQTGGGGTIGM